MPIYDREWDGARVVELGHGDVFIAHGHDAEKGPDAPEEQLLFLTGMNGRIGDFADIDEEATTQDFPGGVCIHVGRLESLDVLIERAQQLREKMAARRGAEAAGAVGTANCGRCGRERPLGDFRVVNPVTLCDECLTEADEAAEDAYWAERAKQAAASGFVGTEAEAALLEGGREGGRDG